MGGELEAVGFRTEAGFDGLDVNGRAVGRQPGVLMSLLGTPHWPRIKGGILFLEDVNEHPYRVERMLLQLQQAGVLDAQKAVLLGDFTVRKPVAAGPRLFHAQGRRRMCAQLTTTPVLTGLPFGHVPPR